MPFCESTKFLFLVDIEKSFILLYQLWQCLDGCSMQAIFKKDISPIFPVL